MDSLMKILVLLVVLLVALASAREKNMNSMLPAYVPTYDYPPMPSYVSDYAPVYYGYAQPEYKRYKKYMPITDYEYVRSVPFIGPNIAFYPKIYQSYGNMQGGY